MHITNCTANSAVTNLSHDNILRTQHLIDVHTLKRMEKELQDMGEYTALNVFEELLDRLKHCKPDDRSEADRYYAIVITEVEKAKAVYMAYCASKPGEET